MAYRKIGPKHPQYQTLVLYRSRAIFMCDALAHNSKKGCPNPNCFNYEERKPRAARAPQNP